MPDKTSMTPNEVKIFEGAQAIFQKTNGNISGAEKNLTTLLEKMLSQPGEINPSSLKTLISDSFPSVLRDNIDFLNKLDSRPDVIVDPAVMEREKKELDEYINQDLPLLIKTLSKIELDETKGRSGITEKEAGLYKAMKSAEKKGNMHAQFLESFLEEIEKPGEMTKSEVSRFVEDGYPATIRELYTFYQKINEDAKVSHTRATIAKYREFEVPVLLNLVKQSNLKER